jgi:hypothetical protein
VWPLVCGGRGLSGPAGVGLEAGSPALMAFNPRARNLLKGSVSGPARLDCNGERYGSGTVKSMSPTGTPPPFAAAADHMSQ